MVAATVFVHDHMGNSRADFGAWPPLTQSLCLRTLLLSTACYMCCQLWLEILCILFLTLNFLLFWKIAVLDVACGCGVEINDLSWSVLSFIWWTLLRKL